jgi:hypothetical protein
MHNNAAFGRAMACLAHPLSLLAVVLLLLNDHLFRMLWPGWWTGKLGGFAWMFFFPFALTAMLAWMLPQKFSRHGSKAAGLAFGLTGGIYALAKTWTPFHAGLIAAASSIFGWQVSWRVDPTDLAALASLVGAAWLLRKTANKPFQQPKQAWLLLGLVGFLTLANSPMPETGITCLEVRDDGLHAYATYHIYRSETGGLTWQEARVETPGFHLAREGCSPFLNDIPLSFTVPHLLESAVVYRITRGEAVERSQDGGQTWQLEYQLAPDSEAMRAYYTLRNHGNAEYFTGPFDAVIDPASGNLILAMGHSGVLLRQVDGSYTWAAVGIYQYEEPGISQVFFILFPGKVLLAAILGGLGVMLLALHKRRFSFRHVLTGISGLGWLFVVLLLPPALNDGYGQLIVMTTLAVSAILLLPLVLEVLIRAGIASKKLLLQYTLVLFASAVLFFLPFIAWGLDILPNYRLAQVFAVVLAGGWLYTQYHKVTLGRKL